MRIHLKSIALTISTVAIAGTVALAQVTDTGNNVGIGNATPAHKLDVNGDINLSTGKVLRIGGNQVFSTEGTKNMFLGDGTGTNLTTGSYNAAIGFKAGEQLNTGQFNTVIGFKAGQNMTSASSNTIIGKDAGRDNTGNQNVLIGREAGKSNEGGENTVIGDKAGLGITTGSSNTLIGKSANLGLGTLTNATAIGANATVNASNALILGNGAAVGIGTSAPNWNFQIHGTTNSYMQLSHTTTGSDITDGLQIGSQDDATYVWNHENTSLLFGTDGAERMRITESGRVGIGTSSPTNRLRVMGEAALTNDVVHVETSYTGTSDVVAVRTKSNPAAGYGYGVFAEGGYQGVHGFANATTYTGSSFGLYGEATGTDGKHYGVYGTASLGGTDNYGIYGRAVGATNNWAGYFKEGNVYMENNVGMGTDQVSDYRLNVQGSATSDSTVMMVEVNSTDSTDLIALTANANQLGGYGVGIKATGGFQGVIGTAEGGTYDSGGYYPPIGVQGIANGTAGSRYGVSGSAYNPGGISGIGVFGQAYGAAQTNYGIYGDASGATTNWAGYFRDGNVHIKNKLGVGTEAPLFPIHVDTDSDRGMYIHLDSPTASDKFGVFAFSNGTSVGSSKVYGVHGVGWNDNGSGNSYGVNGVADGTSTGIKYGVYGEAFGSGTKFAGYFNGDVYSTGSYLPSDRKLKQDIEDVDNALELINKLHVQSYEYQTEKYSDMNFQEGTRYGFIADELKEVFPQFVKTTEQPLHHANPDSDEPEEMIEFEAVNYVELIPILTKAVQEQNEVIEKLSPENTSKLEDELASVKEQLASVLDDNAQLANTLEEVLDRLDRFDSDLQHCCMSSSNRIGSTDEFEASSSQLAATLEQNQPNPFRENSIIKYYLPSNTQTAQLVISDLNGVVLKTFNLQGKGFGQVLISGSSFAAGTYMYTLNVDGKKVATKKMILL